MLEDHLEKLRAFHVTATEGSFLKASHKLGVTQPAITKAVRLLEDQMKATLFVRHARGVTLTPKGTLLNQFCETLFLRVRDLEQQMSSSEQISGIARIGTYETLGELFWPRALTQIGKKLPAIIVELTTENPESHWIKLETGAIDIIVDAEPRVSQHFYSRVLYSDSFDIFCKKDSPLLHTREHVPISYVKRATDRRDVTIEQHLNRSRHKFDLRYSVESFTMVRALVAEGVCVGVLPVRMAKKLVKDGSLVPYLPKEKLENFGEHRICATCVHDLRSEAKISKIIDILRAVAIVGEV